MHLSATTDDVVQFDRYLDTFDRGHAALRATCRTISNEASRSEARDLAWHLVRDVFAAWCQFERDIADRLSPAELVALRQSVRDRSRFKLLRHANFIDASRLLAKEFPNSTRLERSDERNPSAPPLLDTIGRREPAARGDYPPIERTFIEVLDHAALRLQDIDAIHQRIHAAVRVLVPRIIAKLARGERFLLLDVACGGSALAQQLSDALAASGLVGRERARVRILGIDADRRAIPYTYASSGLGWHTGSCGLEVEVYLGDLVEPALRDGIATWLWQNGSRAFDAVVALGIFDYIGCRAPGEDRVYIPERSAPALGNLLRGFASRKGVVIGAVFADEGRDDISTGARHLFANWHIEHATAARMRSRFPFLRATDFRPLTAGLDPQLDRAVHFIVHDV